MPPGTVSSTRRGKRLPGKRSSKSKSTEPSSVEGARRYALRLLAARDYPIAQLKRKLRDRQFREADLEAAVAELEAEHWIDDLRYAERFAEAALESGRCFGIRLRLELQRRGIGEELIDRVLEGVAERYDQEEAIRMLLARHFSRFSFQEAEEREKRRVLAFLQRRGYRTSEIIRAMRATLPRE